MCDEFTSVRSKMNAKILQAEQKGVRRGITTISISIRIGIINLPNEKLNLGTQQTSRSWISFSVMIQMFNDRDNNDKKIKIKIKDCYFYHFLIDLLSLTLFFHNFSFISGIALNKSATKP